MRFRLDGHSRKLVFGGGIVLGTSPFFTWASVALLGDLDLFSLLSANDSSSGWAWCLVLLGGGVAFAATRLRSVRSVRWVGGILGAVVGLYSLALLVSLTNGVEEARGLARLGWGPILAVAGCAAMVIGALLRQPNPVAPGRPSAVENTYPPPTPSRAAPPREPQLHPPPVPPLPTPSDPPEPGR